LPLQRFELASANIELQRPLEARRPTGDAVERKRLHLHLAFGAKQNAPTTIPNRYGYPVRAEAVKGGHI
jgi:hypothetical protein